MLRVHGGRPPRGVLDFSSPLNPLGPPGILVESIERLVKERVYGAYPDYDYRGLREAIAEYYGVAVESVVPLNGAAEGLSLLVLALKPRRLVTVEPTFGDHALASRALGIPWLAVPYALDGLEYRLDPEAFCGLPKESRRESLVILSNPNNPTGGLASRSSIEELAACLEEGSVLVVDEAFSDFAGDSESLLGADSDSIVVLRSFTKIMAVPGLRAGFMYTPNARVRTLVDSVRQPWNVNVLVSMALEEVLRERSLLRDFVNRTVEYVSAERGLLASGLRALGIEVYGSRAPFLLVRQPEQHPGFNEKLICRGIYVRDASSFSYLTPYHSRISVRSRADNLRLLEAVRDVVGKSPQKP